MTAQIQGSTRIKLESGELMRLNYIASNGKRYTPVGRLLIEQGVYTPEETRKNANRPTSGSVMSLNTSAATGSLLVACRSSGSSVFGCVPVTGGTSSGDGK